MTSLFNWSLTTRTVCCNSWNRAFCIFKSLKSFLWLSKDDFFHKKLTYSSSQRKYKAISMTVVSDFLVVHIVSFRSMYPFNKPTKCTIPKTYIWDSTPTCNGRNTLHCKPWRAQCRMWDFLRDTVMFIAPNKVPHLFICLFASHVKRMLLSTK